MAAHSARKKIPEHWHVNWLTTMIFGGAVGLAVEHYAHGEIVPWPPFLTAMGSPADTVAMLKEMAVVGMPMALALVAAWAAIVYVHNRTTLLRRAPLSAAATA